jgi:subtilase family serine protease
VTDNPGRGVPDVALNASINGGVLVFITDPSSGSLVVYIVGGTSVSSPEWAGLAADGVQLAGHRLGFLNRGIYRVGESVFYHDAFHDITSGDNILLLSGIAGYKTRPGWDPVTDWGTPNGAYNTLRALVGNLSSSDAAGL